jgi:hypothetical protein
MCHSSKYIPHWLRPARVFPKLQELSEVQQHKAHHLFHWAREAGKSVSRDEVADMVRLHIKWV